MEQHEDFEAVVAVTAVEMDESSVLVALLQLVPHVVCTHCSCQESGLTLPWISRDCQHLGRRELSFLVCGTVQRELQVDSYSAECSVSGEAGG